MEQKTDMIKSEMFAFNRKVTISGRSLVINIPDDLATIQNKIHKNIPLSIILYFLNLFMEISFNTIVLLD